MGVASVGEFEAELLSAGRPLIDLGFVASGVEDRGHGVMKATLTREPVSVVFWVDPRGELDAQVGRNFITGQGYYAERFTLSDDPFAVRPPFTFGTRQGTSRARALTLLVDFLLENATDALRGDDRAFERAEHWVKPGRHLP